VVTNGKAILLPSTRGDLLILASTLNWAIYTIVGHPTIRRLGALRATAGAMLLGTLMLVPLFAARGGWREVSGVRGASWGAILFLAVGCSAIGYLLWYGALETIDSSRVAVLLYLEPLVTLAAGMLMLGEPLTLTTAIGGLLVLAGVALVQREAA
jgi:drug/metabolite transporter (DMT)-like permease